MRQESTIRDGGPWPLRVQAQADRNRGSRMPMGIAGTTAWALVITVANPVASTIPYANPPVDMETEAECRNIATAINAKAYEAGVEEQISADCKQIEFVDVEELPSR